METVTGVILKTQDYTDSQKIVCVFSKERGYLTLISPSFVFKRNNNSRTAVCMQIAEIELYENLRGGFHKLRTLSPLVNNAAVCLNVYKMNIALLWSEILNLLLRKEPKNDALFDFIRYSVEYLNTTDGDIANFNLFFLYRLAALMGFRINTETYAEGALFNINDGNFVAPGTGAASISGPNAAKAIYRLCTCQVEELKAIPLDRQSRSMLLDIVLLFFGIHLNLDFNVKSIKVLREIFN
ncbi:DNA repair protein RecO [Odoribacter lunatus]|uniref:DNA repair protein RecO n=1 Tax=Odoribacter lunatus TaxID=2941335 RepID=UPI0020424FB3|nr:DNA repair protein RecO C-terminal domain-containing protein [Odoribacter lunatus]